MPALWKEKATAVPGRWGRRFRRPTRVGGVREAVAAHNPLQVREPRPQAVERPGIAAFTEGIKLQGAVRLPGEGEFSQPRPGPPEY